MKRNLLYCLTAFAGIFIISSCSVEKRLHLPGYHVEKLSYYPDRIKVNNKSDDLIIEKQVVDFAGVDIGFINDRKIESIESSNYYDANLIASTGSEAYLLSGSATVSPIMNTAKTSDIIDSKQSKPFSLKESVSERISFFNRTKSENKNTSSVSHLIQSTHYASIVGFITGIISIFIFAYILGTCAIIFSSIALSNIRKNPDKYKGRGLAVAGLVLGIVGIVAYTALLLLI